MKILQAENEIWVDVKGYEGKYEISSLGKVKSVDQIVKGCHGTMQKRKGIILKSTKLNTGYYSYTLWNENVCKQILVHRLLAIHFIPNPLNKPHVNHIDGSKDNNSLNNLEWVTQKENMRHAVKMGVMKEQFQKGFNHQFCKLTPEDVRGIKRMRKEGRTLKEIGVAYGISGRHVSGIYRGETHAEVN